MINQVMLLGRVATKPELYGQNQNVLRFRMATWYNRQNDNGVWEEVTTWHSVVAYNGQVAYLQKFDLQPGDLVHITGSLAYRNRDVNGTNVTVTDVMFGYGSTLKRILKKQPGENGNGNAATTQSTPAIQSTIAPVASAASNTVSPAAEPELPF